MHLFILVKIIVINVKNILLIYWLNKERRLLLQTFLWGSFSSCFLTLSSFFDVFLLIFFFAHVFMHYFRRTKELSFCWYLVILELHYTRRYYFFPLIHFIHRVVVHHTHLIDSRLFYKVLFWLYWYFANISEIAYLFILIFVLCITFNSLMSNSLLWYISRRLYIFFYEISIHMACRRKNLSLTRMPISILKILFLKIHINIWWFLKYLTHHLRWKLVNRRINYLRGEMIIFLIMIHGDCLALRIEVNIRSDWQSWSQFGFIWRLDHTSVAQTLSFLDFSILSDSIDIIACKYVIIINCLLKLMF